MLERSFFRTGNGYISTDTLKEILKELDNKLTNEDLDNIIEEVRSPKNFFLYQKFYYFIKLFTTVIYKLAKKELLPLAGISRLV